MVLRTSRARTLPRLKCSCRLLQQLCWIWLSHDSGSCRANPPYLTPTPVLLPQPQRLSKSSELSRRFHWCGATEVLPHKGTRDAADKAWSSTQSFCMLQSPSISLLMNKEQVHEHSNEVKNPHSILWLQLSVQLPEFLCTDLWPHARCSLCSSCSLD